MTTHSRGDYYSPTVCTALCWSWREGSLSPGSVQVKQVWVIQETIEAVSSALLLAYPSGSGPGPTSSATWSSDMVLGLSRWPAHLSWPGFPYSWLILSLPGVHPLLLTRLSCMCCICPWAGWLPQSLRGPRFTLLLHSLMLTTFSP